MIAAYESRIKALEDRKIVLMENIAKTRRPVRSFDETVRTAFDFLASPWKLWTSERLEDKRIVLKLAFADRLVYLRKEGFRTPDFSLPFKALGNLKGPDFKGGAPNTIRTCDPCLRRAVLYPLSYGRLGEAAGVLFLISWRKLKETVGPDCLITDLKYYRQIH